MGQSVRRDNRVEVIARPARLGGSVWIGCEDSTPDQPRGGGRLRVKKMSIGGSFRAGRWPSRISGWPPKERMNLNVDAVVSVLRLSRQFVADPRKADTKAAKVGRACP